VPQDLRGDEVNEQPMDGLICMMCFQEKDDSPDGYEVDQYGDLWNYCRACDCWTSHPMPKEEPSQ
jgi:hypothetical protein